MSQLQGKCIISFHLNCGTENQVWESEQRIAQTSLLPMERNLLQGKFSTEYDENLMHPGRPLTVLAPFVHCVSHEPEQALCIPLFKHGVSSITLQKREGSLLFLVMIQYDLIPVCFSVPRSDQSFSFFLHDSHLILIFLQTQFFFVSLTRSPESILVVLFL